MKSCGLRYLFILLSLPYLLQANLSPDYYSKTCPDFDQTLVQIVTDKQIVAPTTAAGTLRLFFHDCMVDGCDASILVASTPRKTSERDADINRSLPGDAFDLITRIKTAVELKCPNVVSCSDILVGATHTLVSMVGGPQINVKYGRKDSLVSDMDRVEGKLARPNMTMDHIITIFESAGLTVQEMVALVGSHTIGFSHCKEFASRIFNDNDDAASSPPEGMNPKYAAELRKLCANYTKDEEMSAFNDVFTPGKFDNMTRTFVDLYAANETAFFDAFAKAMVKFSERNVQTEKLGDVRRRCDQYNDYKG
ncbi:unnamed protein product [Microthlaspi erraticum]|uniref:Peroxidase n=1 Tax=Microthlaspi erraticum TaxID=1685480 RepID=A0A6D2J3P5_9BRAS|nr:unnamed protein product [Microthlaspi erraticum]